VKIACTIFWDDLLFACRRSETSVRASPFLLWRKALPSSIGATLMEEKSIFLWRRLCRSSRIWQWSNSGQPVSCMSTTVSRGHGSRSNGRQRMWLWMCHIHSRPPFLTSFVEPCAFLVFSPNSLFPRHDESGVRERKVPFWVAQKVRFLDANLRKICSHDWTRSWPTYILLYTKSVSS
jgi:hypothetical protein